MLGVSALTVIEASEPSAGRQYLLIARLRLSFSGCCLPWLTRSGILGVIWVFEWLIDVVVAEQATAIGEETPTFQPSRQGPASLGTFASDHPGMLSHIQLGIQWQAKREFRMDILFDRRRRASSKT